jgi:hypothetical protein
MVMTLLSRRVGFTVRHLEGNDFGRATITCADHELLVSLHKKEETTRENELSLLTGMLFGVG